MILTSLFQYFPRLDNIFRVHGIIILNTNLYWSTKVVEGEWWETISVISEEDDLVLMGPGIHHVWVNDSIYLNGQADHLADAVVVHFLEDFLLGQQLFQMPELESLKRVLTAARRGLVIFGDARTEINQIMRGLKEKNGIQRLADLFCIFDVLNRTDEFETLASPNYMMRTQQSPYSTDRHSKITDYIMRNFDKDITLNEVASEASMAITTFCNFFKTHYRMTFVEYLNTI